ncbi:hypothetical protein [Gordonia sp. SL306]|uniref:hypothetical protein n=1 Tax=Gordonia sp. SL306 TaxID=2995145 RepID=UPI00226F7EE5|nr:hypothetical protein [Gordonia sp. SL306]WAC54259.1 hypothetical protein OVA31_16400 [Gordonia sp. SL306]
MSRTDKTKPFWVKLAHHDLESREIHDHTDGVCDLPPAEVGLAYTYGTSQCRREFRYTGTSACCCPMCHAQEWPDRTERQRRRRDRRRTRDSLRALRTEF